MNPASSMMGALAGNEIWFVVGFAILILLFIILMIWLLLRARKKAKAEQAPPPAMAAQAEPAKTETADKYLSKRELTRSFKRGWKTYQHYVAGSRNTHLVPWFLAIGEEKAGRSALLGSLDTNRPPAETPDALTGLATGCTWWYYDQAVVLDLGGESILRSDGSPVPDATWTRLLGLLRRFRSRRPLDGLIITIPATDLFGPGQLDSGQLTNKATQLYAKLWQAQKILGLCLPTYVVVTKCDVIPSFGPFVSALPGRLRDGMFGWSSSYPLESSYRNEWLDEAFSQLQASLLQTQVELFADEPNPLDADELFLFPSHFQGMKESLRILLGTMFRRTAYQEALYFRGLYFTGLAPDPKPEISFAPAPGPAVPALSAMALTPIRSAEASRGGSALANMAPIPAGVPYVKPVFVRDLFEQKIFREKDLAKEGPQWSLSYNRTQMAWQAGTALAGLVAVWLLWQGYNRIQDLNAGFIPVLTALPDQMRAAAGDQRSQRPIPGAAVQAPDRIAADVVRGISRSEEDWTDPVFPGAWISGLQTKVVTALSIGYHKTIIGQVRDQMEKKGVAIAQPVSSVEAASGPGLPELVRLREYLGNCILFERFAGVFNNIVGTEDLQGLPQLIKYTHGIEVPVEFMTRAANLGFTIAPDNRSLRGASIENEIRPIDLVLYRPGANARLEQLTDAYLAQVSNGSASMGRLRQVANELSGIVGPERPSTVNPANVYESILRGLTDAVGQFGGQDALWIGTDDKNFGPDLTPLLALIADSTLFGPDVRDRLVARAQAVLTRASADMRPIESAVGPLVARDGAKNRIDLSPTAERLRVDLGKLYGRGFMKGGEGRGMDGLFVPAGPFVWDLATLESAAGLSEDYLLFESRDLGDFPRQLQPSVRAAAQQRLGTAMLAMVARSQIPTGSDSFSGQRTENELRMQVRSFSAAFPLFLTMMQSFRQSGMANYGSALSDAVVGRTNALLARVDELLNADSPYSVPDRGLVNWTRGQAVPATLYGQGNPAGLLEALNSNRQRVASLARELADPLVDFLTKPQVRATAASPLVGKWSRILAELDRYEAGRPNNSVAVLEKFITTDLAEVDPLNCAATLGKSAVGDNSGGDYFMGQLATVRRQVQAQCDSILEQQAVGGYQAIAQSFNELLAGRYPFTRAPDAVTGAQAAPDAVARFFATYDERAEGVLAALKAGRRFGAAGENARQFLERMGQVRAFLNPLLGSEKNADPGYLVDVKFRANMEAEVGGNEVIQWRMNLGDQAIDNFGQRKPQRWRVGEPISVALRWARDGRSAPVAGDSDAPSDVTNGTVTFSYDGPWSMIAMLQQQASAARDWRAGPGRQPHMLTFLVRTEPNQANLQKPAPNAAANAAPSSPLAVDRTAKLFIEVALRTNLPGDPKPGQDERLVMPTFPASAPPGLRGPAGPAAVSRIPDGAPNALGKAN